MPRKATIPSITPHQAQYILEKLIEERIVSADDVRRHIGGMWTEMSAIERRIAELRSIAGSVHPIRTAKRAVRKAKAKITSSEVAASQRLQGKYIAAIRKVPKIHRQRFAKIVQTEGREAAIAAIERHLSVR